MTGRGRVAWIAAAAAGLACASEPPPASSYDPARVSVEVLRGFPAAEVDPHETTAPVVMLLDATRSMLGATQLGPTHYEAAQRAATRFANAVPSLRPMWLYAVGSADSPECQPVFRGSRAANAAARGPLLDEIASVQPRGEGGLAAALNGVREELWRSEALAGSRVVVFSDFGSECGGDVCAAAAKLISGGARLDFVAIGERQAPACLREPTGLAENTPPPPSVDKPLHFRVEVSHPELMVIGCSEAGGLPVAAPPGRGTVVVELDPPLRVEAHFAAGRRHVLQVIDFPALDPATRHWRWMDQLSESREAASQP